jgi:hypothetical protein
MLPRQPSVKHYWDFFWDFDVFLWADLLFVAP